MTFTRLYVNTNVQFNTGRKIMKMCKIIMCGLMTFLLAVGHVVSLVMSLTHALIVWPSLLSQKGLMLQVLPLLETRSELVLLLRVTKNLTSTPKATNHTWLKMVLDGFDDVREDVEVEFDPCEDDFEPFEEKLESYNEPYFEDPLSGFPKTTTFSSYPFSKIIKFPLQMRNSLPCLVMTKYSIKRTLTSQIYLPFSAQFYHLLFIHDQSSWRFGNESKDHQTL
ncbi:hypothetical protein V2J09_016627 [Rumex salicifolius]